MTPTGTHGSFTIDVPDGWQQGPGAFGGWVLAVVVRSIEAMVPGRALRSLTAEITAPVLVGHASVSVNVLRVGRSVTVAAARLEQGGEVRAHAVAVMGASRPVDASMDHVELSRPECAPWQEVPAVPPTTRLLPTFAQHFEFRPAVGLPFAGGSPHTMGFIRARELGRARDTADVVAHVDAWYPAEFPRLAGPRLMVTSAFTMQMVHGAAAWTTDAPLLHTSRTLAAHEGYVVEARQLWTDDGKLIALNQQTMVLVS